MVLFAAQRISTKVIESPLAEHPLIERFLDALRELPDVSAEMAVLERASTAPWRPDVEMHLNVAGKSIVLLVEAKKNA